MNDITFEQAVRNAIEVEREAERFYRFLSDSTADGCAKRFLDDLATQEQAHALRIERFGQELTRGQIPAHAGDNIESVETAPEWRFVDNISMEEAIQIALENEHQAHLYYSTLADMDSPRFQHFFTAIAQEEAEHANRLEKLLACDVDFGSI